MSDPTVHWGFENRGAIDWSALADNDPQNVLDEAASHGLKFGATCSFGEESRPSIGSFARSDRAFTENESQDLLQHLTDLHALTDNLKVLSPETAEALRKLSIEYTHPH
jgi:LuxR family transcriptional regulator